MHFCPYLHLLQLITSSVLLNALKHGNVEIRWLGAQTIGGGAPAP